MAEAAFDLQYDGSALQTHEMDVRDLAPALVATAELFQQMNRELWPNQPSITVNVRATAEGSFLVQLKLIYDQSVEVLTTDDATAGANLSGLVAMAGMIITLIRTGAAPGSSGRSQYKIPPG